MANLTSEVLDYGELVVKQGNIEGFTFTAAGANTYKKGTILARDTATNKLVVYVKGGVTNGNGIPLTVLMSEHVATGAGDIQVRGMTDGVVREDHLVIFADGDASNVDHVERDGLRNFNIDVMKVTDNSVLDNM